MKKWIAAAALLAVISGMLLAGCAAGLKETDVSYAGPMLDQVLLGIKDRDYDAFSKDFGPEMKAAMTEDSFNQLADLLQTKVGDYESKQFASAVNANEKGKAYTRVIYNAKYTDEDGTVVITIVFGGEEGARTVEGLFFSSPNLLKQ
jgi:hypothetical protein